MSPAAPRSFPRSTPAQWVLVLFLFAALAVFSTHPLSTRPGAVLPDNADAVTFAWTVSWVAHQLGRDPLHLLRANGFYPDAAALAYGEPLIVQGLIGWPVYAATGNDVATYNVVLLITLVSCALAGLLLARELTGDLAASLVAGVIFAFTTANYDSAARLQIVSSQWTPLTLLFLVRALRYGRVRDGIACGVCFALQGLSCLYYELFLATLLVLSFPAFVLALPHPRRIPWRSLAAGALVAAALLLPLNIVQQRHLSRIGATRERQHGATWSGHLAALPGNWIYGRAVGQPGLPYDARYFPGAVPVVLGACGALLLSRRVRRRLAADDVPEAARFVAPVAAFGAIAWALSFGSSIEWSGFELPGPFRALQLLPGYAQTRVPSRFLMFTRLALAVLAAYAMSVVLARIGPRRPSLVAPAAMAVALVAALEHVSTPLPTWSLSTGERVPHVYRWLRTLPAGTPALEFPPHPVRLRRGEAFWQHFSTYHWLPMVNGFSSYYPLHYDFLYDQLLELPTQEALDLLHALGVQYLIFHPKPPGTPEGDRAVARFDRRAPSFADQIVPTASFGDGNVTYPDPIRTIGGERVYRLVKPASFDPRPRPADGLRRSEREHWRCEGNPAEGGCALALDGRVDTAFRTPDRQLEGQFVRVVFGRPVPVRAVALLSGRFAAYYPRAVQVRVLSAGDWRPVAHQFTPLDFLRQLLDRPDQAAMNLSLDGTAVDGVEVRLGRMPHSFQPWHLPELNVYE